jgi:hypothetical protein
MMQSVSHKVQASAAKKKDLLLFISPTFSIMKKQTLAAAASLRTDLLLQLVQNLCFPERPMPCCMDQKNLQHTHCNPVIAVQTFWRKNCLIVTPHHSHG